MKRCAERGFTIIETLLFLSISMLLVFIISVGQSSIMSRSRFRDAVESLESRLVQTQEELRSTTNRNATDPNAGRNVNMVVFAKVLEFTYGSSDLNMYECRTSRANGPLPPLGSIDCDPTPASTTNLKWGVTPVSIDTIKPANAVADGIDTIIFFRHHVSGALSTVAYNRTAAGVSLPVAIDAMLTASYGSPTATYRELGLSSSDGYKAVIKVNHNTGVALGTNTTALNQITKEYID